MSRTDRDGVVAVLPPGGAEWTIPATVAGPLTEERQPVLLYVHTGSATVEALGAQHVLAAGDAIWVPPGVRHHTRAETGAVVLPIFPRAGDLPEALAELRTVSIPRVWETWLVQRHVDDLHLDHDVQEVSDARPGYQSLLALARGPVAGAGHDGNAATRPQRLPLVLPESREALQAAQNLLGDPGAPSRAEACAAGENISTRTLQRQFRRETGLSFSEWRTRARIAVATGHLADGREIGWTASHVGYATVSGFAKAFVRHVGVTPGEYARRTRKKSVTDEAPDEVLEHVLTLATQPTPDIAPVTPAIESRRTWTRVNEEHVLLWMYRGEGRVRIGVRDLWLRRGQAVWMPAGVPNTVDLPAGSIAMPLGRVVAGVGLDAKTLTIHEFPPEAETFLLHTSVINCTLFHPETRQRSFTDDLFRAQVIAGRDVEATAGLTGAVATVTRAMRSDPADARSLADWAEHLRLSPRALGDEFLRQTGETFPRWRAQHRMDMARWLLRLGDPPGRVARQLGYASNAAFSNAFTTAHGMSPREHQRRKAF